MLLRLENPDSCMAHLNAYLIERNLVRNKNRFFMWVWESINAEYPNDLPFMVFQGKYYERSFNALERRGIRNEISNTKHEVK